MSEVVGAMEEAESQDCGEEVADSRLGAGQARGMFAD